MGKVPKKRNTARRNNETGVPTSKDVARDIETLQDVSLAGSKLPIIDKLTSDTPGDRAWACAAITNLIVDDVSRKLLLTKNLVSLLIATLNDQHLEVTIEAIGTLRNLSIHDPSTCKEMYQKAIIPAAETLAGRLGQLVTLLLTDAPSQGKDDDEDRKLCYPLMEQFFGLMETCCESTQAFVKALSRSEVIFPFAVEVLKQRERFPVAVTRASVAMLEALAEDNDAIIKSIPREITHALLDLAAESEDPQTRVAAAGVIYNVRSALRDLDWVSPVVSSLSLGIRSGGALLDQLQEYITAAPSAEQEAAKTVQVEDELSEGKSDVPLEKAADARFVKLLTWAQSLQSAFELLSNLSSHIIEPSSADSDDEWAETDHTRDMDADGEDDDAAVEEMHDEDDADAEADEGQDPAMEVDEDAVVEDMTTDVREDELVEVVMSSRSTLQAAFASLLPDIVAVGVRQVAVPQATSALSANCLQILLAVTTLRARALSVLNNLQFSLLSLPKRLRPPHPYPLLNLLPLQPTAHAAVQQLYDTLSAALFASVPVDAPVLADSKMQRRVAADAEMVSMLLGCLWGLLKNFDSETDMGAVSWIQVPPQHVVDLCSLYARPSIAASDECQVRLLGLLGVVGRRQGAVAGNKHIGDLLHSLLPTAATLPPAVLSELLNSIFDIYGDKAYDYDQPVFVRLNMLAALKNSVVPVRARIKTVDKRQHRELRERCEESLLNLREFIKYKEAERKQ
ncbi:hypothetical protein RI367_003497 [Sorochytrium milnesiophthora]